MVSTHQVGTAQTYHCEHCKLVQTKDRHTLKALLRGINSKDELRKWMHALNAQNADAQLKEFAIEQC